MEDHDWSLAEYPARLEPSEFDIVETTHRFEIDLDGNRLTIAAGDRSEQFALDVEVADWTEATLVSWLDRQVRAPWIDQADLLAWLGDAVTHLTRDRGLPLAGLMRCKFILARKLADKIAGFRQTEREKVYQKTLFGPKARVEVSFDEGFTFRDGMYDGVPKYQGAKYTFHKHFLGKDEVPAFDGAAGGEEAQCAFVIDGLPGLRYWMRNVARHRNSFSLPTATDRFYPDFVALMDDGRRLVVEYKGKHFAESADSHEKELIGQAWAKASDGKGVFVMATIEGSDPSTVRSAILDALQADGGGDS